MWETRLTIVDWVYSKTLILVVTLRIQNQLRRESYAYSEEEHSSTLVGCARNKRQNPTVLQNQKLFRWMLVSKLDVLPALDSWDVVIEVLRSSNNVPPTPKSSTPKSKPKGAAGNCVRDNVHDIRLKKEGDRNAGQLSNLEYATTKAHYSQGNAQLYIFEDNEAVINVIIKGRSPTMRHVWRTHRVALDWCWHQKPTRGHVN